MADTIICAKCNEPIKRSESSISTVKNLKKLYYHARCFGADHLEEEEQTADAQSQPGTQDS